MANRRSRPGSQLVLHDIRFMSTDAKSGAPRICATIYCERRQQLLNVDFCRDCERFARIDVHEAGYVMLCRSEDEEVDGDEPTD